MERSREHDDLATALAEVRPAPRQAFAEELDERVAAGFPRRSRFRSSPLAGLTGWIRGLSPQRLLFAGGTAALASIAIATVIVTSSDSGSGPIALDSPAQNPQPSVQYSDAVPPVAVPESSGATGGESGASGIQSSSAESLNGELRQLDRSATSTSPQPLSLNPRLRNREIERSAQISLLADPADVAEDSAKVFAAVHDADGIVLRSTTSSGENAGAHFNLLIASAKLGDALAALSAIDEVRSRHEATDDITAPTVSAREELRDSGARIDALLAQLSATETESEADAVETELRGERRHAARLRERLASLDRRTTYSRVSVRIESGASADSGGTWGFDDAIGDAGRILAVAAGVTLVGLAIIAPLALIAFLAWFARRSWLRRARDRALA
jgi:hypothetical protein